MEDTTKYIGKLHNRRVLIIGGTSGIGLCVAEAALEHGANVTISGSTDGKLKNALAHLRQFTTPLAHNLDTSVPAISGHTCDLSDPSSQESALRSLFQATTVEGKSKLDHVVFTAGNNISIPRLEDITPDLVQAMQNVRILAPIMLAKIVPAYMTTSAHSSLTLTGGTQALKPSPGWSVMAGIMSSITGLTRGFAVDLRPIRVNAVFPGAVKSTATNVMDPVLLEEAMTKFRSTTLTGTVGIAEEVAEAYLYCMKSSYASGTMVVVDGGKLLKE
ncbi:hypothetical protein BST61_g10272 [Cercospora zeina]